MGNIEQQEENIKHDIEKNDVLEGHIAHEIDEDFTLSESLTQEQKHIIEHLIEAKDIKDQTKRFATAMDTYGLETVLSLIPILGDGASSGISLLYMLHQADNMGLGIRDKTKITTYHAIDFMAGSIPFVGGLIDHFGIKSNTWSADLFDEAYADALEKAKQKGVTDDILQQFIDEKHGFWNRLRSFFS